MRGECLLGLEFLFACGLEKCKGLRLTRWAVIPSASSRRKPRPIYTRLFGRKPIVFN